MVTGGLLPGDWLGGALVGGLLGLIVGLLASGVFLMLYRMAMHICGRHD